MTLLSLDLVNLAVADLLTAGKQLKISSWMPILLRPQAEEFSTRAKKKVNRATKARHSTAHFPVNFLESTGFHFHHQSRVWAHLYNHVHCWFSLKELWSKPESFFFTDTFPQNVSRFHVCHRRLLSCLIPLSNGNVLVVCFLSLCVILFGVVILQVFSSYCLVQTASLTWICAPSLSTSRPRRWDVYRSTTHRHSWRTHEELKAIISP